MAQTADSNPSSSAGLSTKVSFVVADNTPLSSSDNAGTTSSKPTLTLSSFELLHISNFNVKSGDDGKLFPLIGLTLSIRAGEIITLEGGIFSTFFLKH